MRKNKFTLARKKAILEGLAIGMNIELICSKAQISKKTYYRWIEEGKKGSDPAYSKFYKDCQKALTVCAEICLQTIKREAKVSPKWAAWFLERSCGYTRESKTIHSQLSLPEGGAPSSEIEDPKTIIWNLLRDLKVSMDRAKEAGSWQAYSALQRTYISTYREYRELSASNAEFEELENLSDTELFEKFKNIYISLNPKLQSVLFDQIGSINSQVIPLKK